MLAAILAAAIAAAAIATQPTPPPPAFADAVMAGRAVVSARFVGMRAPCPAPYADETCFAGLRRGRLVTGP